MNLILAIESLLFAPLGYYLAYSSDNHVLIILNSSYAALALPLAYGFYRRTKNA